MRGVLSTLFLLMVTAASPFALQIPDKKIEITVGDHASAAWYHNPMWIAIAILAAVLVVLLVVLIGRRGGNTIIKN
jgi:membrane protein DedA with SNARE-associated domain